MRFVAAEGQERYHYRRMEYPNMATGFHAKTILTVVAGAGLWDHCPDRRGRQGGGSLSMSWMNGVAAIAFFLMGGLSLMREFLCSRRIGRNRLRAGSAFIAFAPAMLVINILFIHTAWVLELLMALGLVGVVAGLFALVRETRRRV